MDEFRLLLFVVAAAKGLQSAYFFTLTSYIGYAL